MCVVDSVSVLIELIEVSIHCILYARKIYPEGIFELKKKYNVPVHVRLFFNNCFRILSYDFLDFYLSKVKFIYKWYTQCCQKSFKIKKIVQIGCLFL